MSQTKTSSFNLTYRDKIYYMFLSLEVDQEFEIYKKVHPENIKQFIEECKQLIKEDLMLSHYMLFDDHYTKIKKKLKVF